MDKALKTATAIVGLLAGLVTGVYLLGGLVVGLRLRFDHFEFNAIASTLGQLPRTSLVSAALIGVVAPAVVIGFVLALAYGMLGRPKPRKDEKTDLSEGGHPRVLFFGLVVLAVVLAFPGAWIAHVHEGPAPLLRGIVSVLLIYPILVACWYLKRLVAAAPWSRIGRALATGGIWSVAVLIPMLSVSSALPFERVQACLPGAQAPVSGKLIGETSKRILIEEQFGKEAGVIALPADSVTLTESGDLSSRFACPLPAGEKAAAQAAEADLGGHGSLKEQELATKLRPRLRFDGEEPWRPISVPAFAAERFGDGSRHQLCDRGARGSCEPLQSPDQLVREPGEPGYVDIHGDKSTPYEAADRGCRERHPGARVQVLDCNGGRSAAMYYRRTTHEGRWYWDYWWFYRYNDYSGLGDACGFFCADHEGDWEGITVVTTASESPEIIAALYAAHADRALVDGAVLPRAGNHPLVFVAKGTHASYPFWCAGKCRQYSRRGGEPLPETHHDGAVPWGPNSDAECARYTCVRPLPEVGKPGPRALPLAGRWAGWPGMGRLLRPRLRGHRPRRVQPPLPRRPGPLPLPLGGDPGGSAAR